MKLQIIAVGKPQAGWRREAVEHYTRFLSKYLTVESHWVKPAPGTAETTKARIAESERQLEQCRRAAFTILLDRAGTTVTSEDLATRLRTGLERGGGTVRLLIGGIHGVTESVRDAADWTWSLSPLTLPHELALILGLEQLARACSIDRGEKYHR